MFLGNVWWAIRLSFALYKNNLLQKNIQLQSIFNLPITTRLKRNEYSFIVPSSYTTDSTVVVGVI
jgi:hypothetical protein